MANQLEDHVPTVKYNGLNSAKNGTLSGVLAFTGANTHTGAETFAAGVKLAAPVITHTASAINSTATATAAQVATGYITSTSAAATSITLPTGTLLGAALGAVAGTVFDLIIDNTAGASTVTMVVAVNGVLSESAATTAASFGDLTVPAGVTGIGRYTLMFSSATAYAFTRTA